MLDKDTLLKHRTFASEEQIEKDYLQHMVLRSIYEKATDKAVFKGGTALQKAFGLSRFSEDLDFTLNGDAMKEIDRGLENLSNYCDVVNNIDDDRIVKGGVTSFLLRLRGPVRIETITIDIVNEQTLLSPMTRQIRPIYNDPQPYLVHVMNEKEILAEKARAMLSREAKKARDLYDIYFMLMQSIDIDMELVYGKLKFIGGRFSINEFRKSVMGLENRWDDLRAYVGTLPQYGEVASYVLEKFENIL